MNKFIRVTAIVGAALVALALLLLLVSIPLQGAVVGVKSEGILQYLPIFPVAAFVNLFLLLGCCALMIVCAGNQKGGIWLEILLLIALVAVLPLINTVLSSAMSMLAVRVRGNEYMAAYSLMNSTTGYFTWTAGIGRAITLVACGMSITYKKLSK